MSKLENEKWEQIAKCCGCKITNDKFWTHVTIPSFDCIADFNDDGIPDIVYIHNAIKKTQFIVGHCLSRSEDGVVKDDQVKFLEMDKFMQQRFTFLGSLQTKINPSYYILPKRAPCNDLRWSFRLGNMGTSSFNIIMELNSNQTNEIYVTNINQYIAIDKNSRTCTTLPDWWVAQFKTSQDLNISKLHLKPFRKPELCESPLVHKIGIRDVDQYNHTSYIVYMSLCLDYVRTKSGVLKVMETSNLYMKESKLNDEMHIYGWIHEDTKDKQVYRFQLEKVKRDKIDVETPNEECIVFQAEIVFYHKSHSESFMFDK